MPYELTEQDEYLLLKLKGEFMDNDFREFGAALDALRDKSKKKYVLVQCAELKMLSDQWFRQLAQSARSLSLENGNLRLVGANAEVQKMIGDMGLDRILMNKMSLRGAMVDMGLAKAKEIDVKFINPFLNATLKTFKVQCFMEAKPGKPTLKRATDPLLLGDISGIISITSETFTGTLAISLSEDIFKAIAEKMLGEKIEEATDENIDLVGELANIILGQAKIELNTLGFAIQMALPSCVWGKDHKIKHFGGGICIIIPFETEFGTFYTEIMTNTNLLEVAKKAS